MEFPKSRFSGKSSPLAASLAVRASPVISGDNADVTTKLLHSHLVILPLVSLFYSIPFTMNYRASVLLSLFLAFVTAAQTIKTVTRDGRYLYTDAGATRFFIKGVAYQPQGHSCFHDLLSKTKVYFSRRGFDH